MYVAGGLTMGRTAKDPIGFNGGLTSLYELPRHKFSLIFPLEILSSVNVGGDPVNFVDVSGLDILIIHNGSTGWNKNPLGHTAMAVEGAGLYSFGNADKMSASINNNIMGGNLEEYIQREATRRDTRFTLIETSPEQDRKILDALQKEESKSGYIDNCATRTGSALDTLYDDLTFWQKIKVGKSNILPISVEDVAGSYMNILGGSKYNINQSDTKNITLPKIFSTFEKK